MQSTLKSGVASNLWKGGSPGRTRTSDQSVNSRPLYQLSYRGTLLNGGAF